MAKVEMEISAKKILAVVVLLAIGIAIGFAVAGNAAPESKNNASPSCITTQDMNRQDLIGVITLSRFCEGLGLASSVLQQQDANGNIYGLPVCVQRQQ